MDLSSGVTIDRYTVEARLGEGGMAVVYKVRHTSLASLHALKVLTVSGASLRERLLLEGRVQASLRHPNVVTVTDVIDVNGAPGLILDFVDGPNLGELLDRRRLRLDEADALAFGILEGVAAAHAIGLIHRDLKPANVLIAQGRGGLVPKVADFGLAKVLDGDGSGGMRRTRSGTAMGTPSYMAPEQIRNAKAVGASADVFSLGAILYELYCGEQAFPGEDMWTIFSAITSGSHRPVRDLGPHLPDRVVEAIEGALRVSTDERIPDCDQLLRTLRGDRGISASPTTGGQSTRRDATWTMPSLAPVAVKGAHPPPESDSLWAGPPSPLPPPPSPTLAALSTGPPQSAVFSTPSTPPVPPRSSSLPLALGAVIVAVGGLAGVGIIGSVLWAGLTVSSAAPEPAPAPVPVRNAWVTILPAPTKLRLGLSADPKDSDVKGFRPALDVQAPTIAYSIQAHEVTWAEMEEWWVKSPGDRFDLPSWAADPVTRADLPVGGIAWSVADRYCKDLNGRLPTEAEWEYAARGPDLSRQPWDAAPPGLRALAGPGATPAVVMTDGDVTPTGVYDLVGNVQEWAADRWTTDDPAVSDAWSRKGNNVFRSVRGVPLAESTPLPAEPSAFRDRLCAAGDCLSKLKGSETFSRVGFRCVK